MKFIAGVFPSHLTVFSRHLSNRNKVFYNFQPKIASSIRWKTHLLGTLFFLVVSTLSVEAVSPPYVHYFSCDQCHYAGMAYYEVTNVCLNCHTDGEGTAPIMDNPPPGVNGTTEGLFLPGDASNAGGNNADLKDYETSHSWYAPTDTRPEFGASAPLRTTENRFFYSRYGTSTGKITCSRCHLPHAYTDNPQLLVMGPDSADKMCQACHQSWVLNERGWLTHPIIDNYDASVAEHPDKYRSSLSNTGAADVKLVGGGVSCTSCHGVHFVDSDSATTDGHSKPLSHSDGKLLRGDGPDRADKSSLCQTCHTYEEHGDNTGEKVGCLVCHSGHSYDPVSPNYYVLRKSATTTRFNTVNGLAYSSSDVLIADLKYTFWNDRVDGATNGYCEKCHGDAKEIGGGSSYHTTSSLCTDCHSHEGSTFVNHADGGGDICAACHGHDAGYEYAPSEFCEGRGTTQSHSTHTENDADDLRGPNISCDGCHVTNNLPAFKSGTDTDGNGVYSLNETDICDTCHSPSGIYDGVDDSTLGAKPNWGTGVYNGLNLQEGKEKWCATCHDEAPAVISSVNAPNVIGDEDGSYTYGTGWGYYKTGHGLTTEETFPSKGGVETLSGRAVECNRCHDYATAHIDGEARTYDDGDSPTTDPSVYRQGYRLKLIDGQEPLLIPRTFGTPNNTDTFRVCFQIGCHDSGPFTDAVNMNTNLVTDGINRHEYHLRMTNSRFASDWSGEYSSGFTCVNCHNVHGSTQLAMVRDGKLTNREPGMQIWYKNDDVTYFPGISTPPEPQGLPLPASDGTAWIGGSSANLCANCHGSGIVTTEDRTPFQNVARAPVLAWAGGTDLVSDGIAPDGAVGNSTFTFRVFYSDSNNDRPSPIEVWVDENDNGSYEADEKYAMTETEVTDTNIFDGKIYTQSLSIAKVGDNVLNYRFYAHDGGLEATGPPTVDNNVIILNNAPVLNWAGEDFYQNDGTNPDTGGNGGTFTFHIDYADTDDEAPSSIQVWVDENDDNAYSATEKYALTEVNSGDITYRDGKLYTRSLSLVRTGDGDLKYRFYAADAQDDATGSPTQDATLTVQVGTNSPPSLEFIAANCAVSGAKPQSGATGADFVFTVRYTDSENEAPSTIQVWIDENDNNSYEGTEQYLLTEVDGGDTTYSDGKLYSTTRVLTLAGDNDLSYRFHATDGTDTAVGEAIGNQSVTVIDALKVRPAGGSGWYNTIQSAIDAINGAHTVLVYDGTYNEDVLFEFGGNDSNTTLRSACGPDTTIINGSGSGTTVTFSRYSSSQIDGFQVTGGTTGIAVNGTDVVINNCQVHDNNGLNGGGIAVVQSGDMPTLTLTNSEIYNNSSDRGGGVRIWRGLETPGHTISNTIIRNNTAVSDDAFDGGGGLHLSQVPNITISHSIIRDNVSDLPGGGLCVAQVPDIAGNGLTINDSTISGNTSGSSGGGVYNNLSTINFFRSNITGNTAAAMGGAIAHPSAGIATSFENCVLADNQANQAGMAKLNGGTLDITNSTIANNRATGSNSGAIYNQLATITIRNSILWGNQAAAGSHIAHFNGGSMTITDSVIQSGKDGNFTNTPFFGGNVTPSISGYTSEDDPWFVGNGDYHVLAPSPAIDNASATYAPALDIDGQSRPRGASDDIGADEY